MRSDQGFDGFPVAPHLSDAKLRNGVWDEPSQLWLVVPVGEFEVREELDFLIVGRPGVDGIDFGYRRNVEGFWAYYPIENELVLLADDIHGFLEGWYEGSIVL